jgi:glycine/D-amino acid oxidase-like deaminating enzyme
VNVSPDVIVVGAGIVGAALALAAASEGLRVLVLSEGLVGDGVSAAGMGHLVVLDDDPAELALCKHSLGLWRAWADNRAMQYHPCGTLWIAGDESERALLQAKQRRLAAAGIDGQWLAGDEVGKAEPSLRPGLAAGLRVASDAAVYAPGAAAEWVRQACEVHGAQLRTRCTVRALRAGGVQLDDDSVIHAAAVVVAAGIHTARLIPALPFVARKGHLAITDRLPRLRVSHQVVEVGYGASAHADADSVAFNIQPRPTGQLLIGSCRQPGHSGSEIDPHMLARMSRRAIGFMPALQGARVLRTWTGVRPGTPDGRPYIGRWPGVPGAWVAAGHEGIGVTTAPGSARLLIDQLLQRETAIDASPYDPARVMRAQVPA